MPATLENVLPNLELLTRHQKNYNQKDIKTKSVCLLKNNENGDFLKEIVLERREKGGNDLRRIKSAKELKH